MGVGRERRGYKGENDGKKGVIRRKRRWEEGELARS